jgi:hypothetical protein
MIGTTEGVSIANGRLVVRGTRRELAWGFSAFKLFNYIAQHFTGHGDEFKSLGGTVAGALNIVRSFVENRQALVGRKDVWFRLFSQTGDGEPGSWQLLDNVDQGMFGSPPHEPNPENSSNRLWDYNALRRGHRPESVTPLMAKCLAWLFEYSQQSGACFEVVVDATIKHMDEMTPGTIDHMCRQMAIKCRELQVQFPRACIILSTDNECFAHNRVEQTLADVNLRAKRFYRWKDASGGLRQSFTSPGGTFQAEQWPEGIVIVDEGGGDFFTYDCGPEPDKFKLGAIHPERKGGPRDWRDISSIMARLTADSRGMPPAFPESMYYADNSTKSLERANRIYRNRNGWHANADDMMLFYQRWVGKIGYGIIHTEKDVQGSIDWPLAETPLEERLRAFFGTGQTEPPPPPPSTVERVTYRHVIEGLYEEILQRPADAGGGAFYDEQMRLFYGGDGTLGLSRANVENAMLGSAEYAAKFTAAFPA